MLDICTHDPKVELDDDDAEELYEDCLAFVEQMIARNLPKGLNAEAHKLHKRLEEVVGWISIH